MRNEYNRVLARCNKAIEWLDNPKRTETEKEKYLPEFNKILKQLDAMILDFKRRGCEMTREEILNGFKE